MTFDATQRNLRERGYPNEAWLLLAVAAFLTCGRGMAAQTRAETCASRAEAVRCNTPQEKSQRLKAANVELAKREKLRMTC